MVLIESSEYSERFKKRTIALVPANKIDKIKKILEEYSGGKSNTAGKIFLAEGGIIHLGEIKGADGFKVIYEKLQEIGMRESTIKNLQNKILYNN